MLRIAAIRVALVGAILLAASMICLVLIVADKCAVGFAGVGILCPIAAAHVIYGLRFRRIWADRILDGRYRLCLSCGYALAELPQTCNRCPECGCTIDVAVMREKWMRALTQLQP